MSVLLQFLLRLSFGLAIAMAVLSPRQVTSGYFRNHAYVLLGLLTLGTLAAKSTVDGRVWLTAAAAVASYFTSVAWLYDARRLGRLLLVGVAILAMVAVAPGTGSRTDRSAPRAENVAIADSGPALGPSALAALAWADLLTSGILLGVTTAAMLLGHWYLNSPAMELAPLYRLISLLFVALAVRVVVSAAAGGTWIATAGPPDTSTWILVSLRWTFGFAGLAMLAWMARQTLRIPNTQSATGILYVAVIAVFAGELTSLLLSDQNPYLL